jgi:glutamate transport system ATP-binding protein
MSNTQVKNNTSSEAPVIELQHVDKHYGDLHVLKDINLSVKKGEVVVVIGPSGSGKSTLCRTINRLETIDSGCILIEGEKLPEEGAKLAELRSKVGMVFQSFNLFAHKTILDNVTMAPMNVLHKSKMEARSEAMELLSRVGVDSQASKLPSQLSGGQQQRVAIARALVGEPAILLADEPTGALDRNSGLEVLKLFKRLNDMGNTIVMITHDSDVATHAKRTVRIVDGEIFEAC